MAISKIAAGKAVVAMNKGLPLADGLLIDANGQPSNDPKVLFADPRGALLPIGEHKGYGLGVICELFAGALGGGGTVQPKNTRRTEINNMLSIIIDRAALSDTAFFETEVDALVAWGQGIAAPARRRGGACARRAGGARESRTVRQRNPDRRRNLANRFSLPRIRWAWLRKK